MAVNSEITITSGRCTSGAANSSALDGGFKRVISRRVRRDFWISYCKYDSMFRRLTPNSGQFTNERALECPHARFAHELTTLLFECAHLKVRSRNRVETDDAIEIPRRCRHGLRRSERTTIQTNNWRSPEIPFLNKRSGVRRNQTC